MSGLKTVFRIEAIRYGLDGYAIAVRWRVLPLDADDGSDGPLETVPIERAIIEAHGNRVYAWGRTRVVNKIRVFERPFGGLMLGDTEGAPIDGRLAALPSF